MAQTHVSDNPFHALCLKIIKKLFEAPNKTLNHRTLLKRMKMDSKSFNQVMGTLSDRGDIDIIGTGLSKMEYKLRIKDE